MISLIDHTTQLNVDCEEGSSSGLTADQLMRQTFDRFDDNLVENILSFLTFNEKVMFECVSKTFQKLVYIQQKQLSLTRWEGEGDNTLNKLLEPIEVVDYNSATAVANGLKKVNKFWLKSILKKCKSIEEVVLDCYLDLEDLDIICRNCPQIKTIEFDTSGLSAEDLDHLGNRYGEQFEKVNLMYLFISPKYWNKFLIHCKNLKEITAQNISQLLNGDKEYLPKLEVINNYQVNFFDEECDQIIESFAKFCDKYSNTLKKLQVSFSYDMKKWQMDLFFNSIIVLKKLKELNLYFQSLIDEEGALNQCISQMTTSNPELKSLTMSLSGEKCPKINEIFLDFQEFNHLVELDIYIYGLEENLEFKGSVECLKNSKNLKHLTISIQMIGEDFFKDIDKHLPNLTKLIISCENEFTDKTILQLSQLKKLNDFYLNRFRKCNKEITDESICAVINGCPALEMFCFGSRPKITEKTIETLILCANTNPKRRIHFSCGLSEEGDEEQHIPTIDMLSFIERVPENLTIDYNIAQEVIED